MGKLQRTGIAGLTAVILAGGIGKRLRPITYTVPKPLVKIRGKPFLHYLLYKVASMGIRKCVLLTGYKHGAIREYCGSGKKWGLKISYSREKKPLGTGGALLNAGKKIDSTALVLNGDTYSDLDIGKFLAFHRKHNALATIFSMKGSLKGRGEVKIASSGRVARFLEKKAAGTGNYNAGAYLVEPEAINFLQNKLWKKGKRKFSLEEQGFPLLMSKGKLFAFRGRGRFLDIGTFESLSKAGSVLD